ncbi:ankyrin repeat domain-containing protein 13B [Carex littledalei]|uniref:Ankyrin repeat domain-containing protein 13B n=1 Tax=Carex littledalei TaxID=544730 RepID=A0A833RFT9_9POAL|nr:ankyrin repeat domain-containing protein 13B [Carex littledalei]
MASIDAPKYEHSPIHLAVLNRDYTALRQILNSLPRLSHPSEVQTEADSLEQESKSDAISAQIDRRDVPGRETPLHLAVRLGDATSVELLMSAGADWSLQNEQGWSALQEAICAREEVIAKIIVRHYQPLAWAKWCRRLPRVVATMQRMRNFYMEITFHFESSVIPFISRIAPSDTYKIWKRGSNLRADMTLAGFDGFRIQRSDQTILFLGEGSEDGKIPPGSLCMINHKDREIVSALEGAGTPASEAEVEQEVTAMSQTNIFRPGIDVTEAVLLPQLTWRRQERTESVGPWKAKVYDMHNVVVSVKSRRVPGAMTDEEFLSSCNNNENDTESEHFEDVLTEEERKQLEAALNSEDSSEAIEEKVTSTRHSNYEQREIPIEDASGSSNSATVDTKHDKKGWFGSWGRRRNGTGTKYEGTKKGMDMTGTVPPRSSLCVDEKVSDLLGADSPSRRNAIVPGRHSIEVVNMSRAGTGRDLRKTGSGLENGLRRKEGKESEYKKGLRSVLWLSPNFPLRTEELLPLLDILANKVKAIRRLRDLLATKLPPGTFPVKVAIPVVPTIRVLVTFTKFEELQPLEEFSTPLSSPSKSKSPEALQPSSSWIQWIKAPLPYRQTFASGTAPSSCRVEDIQDPFAIPPDYTWTTPEAKKKKTQDNKNKSKKVKTQNQ